MASEDYTARLAEQYSPDYYAWQQAGARRSADVIAPLLRERLHPASVIDVGCGRGAWPAAWIALGVEDVLGVDGEHVRQSGLLFPDDRFVAHDLRRPLELERSFDLVLSLEVAQHPPGGLGGVRRHPRRPRAGDPLLRRSASPGGRQPHQRALAELVGGAVRAPRLLAARCRSSARLADERVDWWYAQNAILYLQGGAVDSDRLPLDLVHPRNLLHAWSRSRRRSPRVCGTRSHASCASPATLP